MKKIFLVFFAAGFFCTGILKSHADSNRLSVASSGNGQIILADNNADQKNESEKRAAEDRIRQEKIEADRRERADAERERKQKADADRREAEERARQEKAENDRRAEEERSRREKIESDRREQEQRQQQKIQDAEKKAYEDRIRQEKINADRIQQEQRQQQKIHEAEKKAYEDRIRQEKIEADRRQQEMKLHQQQIEAEKKAQEAGLIKDREEAKRQAEEARKQQQRLEDERREDAQRIQKKEAELRRERERLEAERKRAEDHRRWHQHNSHRHNHSDRPHYHRNNRYNDESTIIFTEQYNIYTDPYSGQYQESYPPENVYSSPGTAGSHNSGSSAVQDEAGDDIRSADDIITEILENEALEPDMDLSGAGWSFCRDFMKSLKNRDGQVMFIDPAVVTDDPKDPELSGSFPCYGKSGSNISISRSIKMAGERKFRLYKLKKAAASGKPVYDYLLYAEPFENSERSDLFPGYSRVDSSTCGIRRELIVRNEDSATGSFSTIVSYKKQLYVFDVAEAGSGSDQASSHIIKLHQYSSKKGAFEQEPYAYWSRPEPLN